MIEIKTTNRVLEDTNFSINEAIPEQPRYRKQKVIQLRADTVKSKSQKVNNALEELLGALAERNIHIDIRQVKQLNYEIKMPDNSSIMGRGEERRAIVMEHLLGNSELLKSEK